MGGTALSGELSQLRTIFRVVQMNSTPEIKVFYMLFDRSLSIFWYDISKTAYILLQFPVLNPVDLPVLATFFLRSIALSVRLARPGAGGGGRVAQSPCPNLVESALSLSRYVVFFVVRKFSDWWQFSQKDNLPISLGSLSFLGKCLGFSKLFFESNETDLIEMHPYASHTSKMCLSAIAEYTAYRIYGPRFCPTKRLTICLNHFIT